MNPHQLYSISVSESLGSVSAIWFCPPDAKAMFVFAHGAGAGMNHPFMTRISDLLFERRIATLRYNFLYMEKKSKRPDPPAVAIQTVSSAVQYARTLSTLPIFVGGKSFGGRMTSTATSKGLLGQPDGLIFLGFPLHPAGKPSLERAEHLTQIRRPMLFLHGSKDALADLDLLRFVCSGLGGFATLKTWDFVDHSFHAPKSSGKSDSDTMTELAEYISIWISDRFQ